MCGARIVLAYCNSVLSMVGGAALVACAVIYLGHVPERVESVPTASVPTASVLLTAPYVCGPVLLFLSNLAVTALHSAPSTARILLAIYSVLCLLSAMAAGGVAGWSGVFIARWLRLDANAPAMLREDQRLRVWLQPFMPFLPEGIESVFPEEKLHVEVVSVLVVCALTVLVLLVSSALALMARPRRPGDYEHALRPCSSVYYEPSAPPPALKTPLDDPARWH